MWNSKNLTTTCWIFVFINLNLIGQLIASSFNYHIVFYWWLSMVIISVAITVVGNGYIIVSLSSLMETTFKINHKKIKNQLLYLLIIIGNIITIGILTLIIANKCYKKNPFKFQIKK